MAGGIGSPGGPRTVRSPVAPTPVPFSGLWHGPGCGGLDRMAVPRQSENGDSPGPCEQLSALRRPALVCWPWLLTSRSSHGQHLGSVVANAVESLGACVGWEGEIYFEGRWQDRSRSLTAGLRPRGPPRTGGDQLAVPLPGGGPRIELAGVPWGRGPIPAVQPARSPGGLPDRRGGRGRWPEKASVFLLQVLAQAGRGGSRLGQCAPCTTGET